MTKSFVKLYFNSIHPEILVSKEFIVVTFQHSLIVFSTFLPGLLLAVSTMFGVGRTGCVKPQWGPPGSMV